MHVCGPLNVILASVVSIPVKPSNGAANESEQSVCVTMAFCPMRDASQCAVTVHVPDTSGHAAPPPSDDGAPAGEELELHAHGRQRENSAARKVRGIRSWYPLRRRAVTACCFVPRARRNPPRRAESCRRTSPSPRTGVLRAGCSRRCRPFPAGSLHGGRREARAVSTYPCACTRLEAYRLPRGSPARRAPTPTGRARPIGARDHDLGAPPRSHVGHAPVLGEDDGGEMIALPDEGEHFLGDVDLVLEADRATPGGKPLRRPPPRRPCRWAAEQERRPAVRSALRSAI